MSKGTFSWLQRNRARLQWNPRPDRSDVAVGLGESRAWVGCEPGASRWRVAATSERAGRDFDASRRSMMSFSHVERVESRPDSWAASPGSDRHEPDSRVTCETATPAVSE